VAEPGPRADCASAGVSLGLPPFPRRFGRGSAGVAQLVERQPSKLNVAGSSPVSRSCKSKPRRRLGAGASCVLEHRPESRPKHGCLGPLLGRALRVADERLRGPRRVNSLLPLFVSHKSVRRIIGRWVGPLNQRRPSTMSSVPLLALRCLRSGK
jgi:hypothetical protein